MNLTTDGNFHIDFIELLAKRMKPNIYLELGLGPDAECMNRVVKYCRRALGVDSAGTRKHDPSWELYHCTTDDFFLEHAPLWLKKESVEMAFVDANHSKEAAEQDFFNVFPYVSHDGLIFLHDTFPENDSYKVPEYCGDAYVTAQILRVGTGHYGYEICTLPTPPGLTIIRKL